VRQGGKREVAEGSFDPFDQRDVAAPRAIGEPAKVFAALILLEHAQEGAPRLGQLLRDGFVIGRDEFWCARLPPQGRSAFPSVVINDNFAACELLTRAIDPLKSDTHVFVSP